MPVSNAVRLLGIIDILIVIVIAAFAVAFIPVMRTNCPAAVLVRCDNKVIARYPCDRCAEFRVQGAEGPLDIIIDKDGAAVVHAACRNLICVHTGHIRYTCQKIICAPNHVVIEIESTNAGNSPDAVAR
jgi:hypothetical protein